MLCQFAFANYKSFKDEAMIDFIAAPINENNNSLIVDKLDKEKYLPVIVLYGPNGGGKSTVLESLNFLRTFLLNKIIPLRLHSSDTKKDEHKWIKMMIDADFKEKYHKFDDNCKDIPSSFDILFRLQNTEFKYQLSLLHNQIVEENLYERGVGQNNAKIIFERSSEDIFLGDDLKGIAVEKLRKSMPLLSHISINYDIDTVDEVVSWLSNITFLDYGDPQKDSQIILPNNKKNQDKLFTMLHEMDVNISGFRLEKDTDGNIIEIYTKHGLPDDKSQEILFEEESSGTRKLFGCLAEIIDCLHSGSVLVADELDAKLHPKLLRYIIELFTNPQSNRNGAQLLLTSHDMTTMIPEVYRRDEICFCALNPSNASMLYPLITFKKENGKSPRKDESYGKQYIEGRYGADPYLKKLLDWEV